MNPQIIQCKCIKSRTRILFLRRWWIAGEPIEDNFIRAIAKLFHTVHRIECCACRFLLAEKICWAS